MPGTAATTAFFAPSGHHLGSCRLTGEEGRRELVESDVTEKILGGREGGRRNTALEAECRNKNRIQEPGTKHP